MDMFGFWNKTFWLYKTFEFVTLGFEENNLYVNQYWEWSLAVAFEPWKHKLCSFNA